MSSDRQTLEVRPIIVRAGEEAEISVRLFSTHTRFYRGETYEATVVPLETCASAGNETGLNAPGVVTADGALRFRARFGSEQEHLLRVSEVRGGSRRTVGAARIYSLSEDFFRLDPYKGDFHIHSCRSDGVELPGFVAASCRGIGCDFMALTDHGAYAPSLEARDEFEGVGIDLRVFPGEEVHLPGNPVHIVNFGGGKSVNELAAVPSYRREIEEKARALGPPPHGVDPRLWASTLWCFEKIRDSGGLGILCHPYWKPSDRFDLPGDFVSALYDARPFDAVEVVGGYERHEMESNLIQVARYHESRARGKDLGAVGVSDAHGCDTGSLFGWYYTVVFADSPELPGIVSAVRERLSVAVEAVPGSPTRAHGPARLVNYTHFLLREYFPKHDELCVEEGRLMRAHLTGDGSAAAGLLAARGRTAKLLSRCKSGAEELIGY